MTREHDAGSPGPSQPITPQEETAEALRRQNEFLAALHETTLGIVSRLNVDELLEAMVSRAAKLFGGFASIYLVDPGADELVARIASGPYRQLVGFRLKRGEGLCGKVWQLDRPMWVGEYNQWEGRAVTSTYPDRNVERSMGVPLHSGQEVVGVLGVSRPLTAPPFQQDEVDIAIRLANLASIAFDNARLYSSAQEQLVELQQTQQALEEAYQTLEQRVEDRTRELSTLLEVSKNLVTRLELEPLLGSILDELKRVVDYEGCVVFALEGDQLVARAHRGRTPEAKVISMRYGVDDPLDHLVLRGREPVLVADTRDESQEAQAYRESAGGLHETLFPHIRSWLGVPLIVKGRMIGELSLDHGRAQFFTPAHARLAMAFANQAAIALENARLYEAEQSRREEADRRRRVAESLREILATLNSRRPLAEILDYIVKQASELLGSDAAAIDRLDQQSELLTVRASHGLDAEFAARLGFRVGGESVVGEALRTRQPMMTFDLAAHMAQAELPPEMRELAERFAAQYAAMLAVPMFTRDGTYGALTLYYRSAPCFCEEDVNLAVTFADQAALAIENARLHEQAEQAAAMEERGRLARELHDSVTQSIYSVTMYTEAAARLLTAGQQTNAAEYLREARDSAQDALREMRLLIYQLRPPVLEKGGLAVALQVRLDAVERRGGIHAELMLDGEDRLPAAVQAELHQIAQEALNNALKHAHAGKVQVRLNFGEAITCLEVLDDGVGFEPSDVQAGGGLGLPGMAERVQKIGGRLRIASAPGQGTRVIVEVPTGGEG